MQTAKRLNNINEYYFSTKLKEIEKLKADGKKIISLAIGGPDLPPSQKVLDRLSLEINKPNQHSYQSYNGNKNLRVAIATWYKKFYQVNLDADKNILPLMGSKEGILHICFTFLNDGDEVLVPNPGYPAYSSAVNMAGGIIRTYNLLEKNNWLIDFDELQKQDLSKVKMMWVNYPNMPTGTQCDENFYKKIVAFGNANNILICHDNPYSFIRNDSPKSILLGCENMDNVIELNSLSKSHNMAGWRVGMMISSEENLKNILKFKSNMDSGMFLPIQLAASEALGLNDDWYSNLNKIYFEREKKAIEIAHLLRCKFTPNQIGLFLWAKIPDTFKNCYDFCDKLLYESDIFITPGSIFGSNGEKYIRISLCSPTDIFDHAIANIKLNYLKQDK